MARWWEPTNDLPNPWSGELLSLPAGRSWGSTAGVDVDPTNGTVRVIDRCGSNTCVGSDLDPILQYDADGTLLQSFGSEMFAFPHGIHVDLEGNVWVTDPLPVDGRGAGGEAQVGGSPTHSTGGMPGRYSMKARLKARTTEPQHRGSLSCSPPKHDVSGART